MAKTNSKAEKDRILPFSTMIRIKCTLQEEGLGMQQPTKELLQKFIDLTNARLEKKKKQAIPDAKAQQEIKALSNQIDQMKNDARGYLVFPRDEQKRPIIWDYQIKGMFKDCFKALIDSDCELFKKSECGFSQWTCDRLVDREIFPHPRMIPIILPEGGEIGRCDRTLRTKNPTTGAEMNTIQSSESVPAGSTFEFSVEVLKKSIIPQIKVVFDYGALRGVLGWRNSGKGRYTYEIIEE